MNDRMNAPYDGDASRDDQANEKVVPFQRRPPATPQRPNRNPEPPPQPQPPEPPSAA